jgi:hypothetical protein
MSISCLLRGNFNDDDGPFNDVRYSLGLFNGEPSYFTGSEDIEIRGRFPGESVFLSSLFAVVCAKNNNH